jgi:hypothetical protein
MTAATQAGEVLIGIVPWVLVEVRDLDAPRDPLAALAPAAATRQDPRPGLGAPLVAVEGLQFRGDRHAFASATSRRATKNISTESSSAAFK